jgi:hypothetical protein
MVDVSEAELGAVAACDLHHVRREVGRDQKAVLADD